eukprot:4882884-Heterocapsa_arctica.AAC.1
MEARGNAALAERSSSSLRATGLDTYMRPCSFYPSSTAEAAGADFGRLGSAAPPTPASFGNPSRDDRAAGELRLSSPSGHTDQAAGELALHG